MFVWEREGKREIQDERDRETEEKRERDRIIQLSKMIEFGHDIRQLNI